MTTIFLICAAESEADACRIIDGQLDFPLTASGVRQAETLGRYFEDKPVSALYCSDLRRAADTAELIQENTDCKAVHTETLREIAAGAWEGALFGNLAYEEPRKLEAVQLFDPYWRVPDAESVSDAAGRLRNAILSCASAHPDSTIAIVSHKYVVGALLNTLSGDSANKPAGLSPCAIAVLRSDGSELLVDQVTDGPALLISVDPDSVPARTVPDFDTDACCYLLREIEYGDTFVEAIQAVWGESGEDRPFDSDILMNDASRRTTYMGFVEQTPACFLQTGPLPGWITLLVVHPGCRNLGVGAQMIGLAAMNARSGGADRLSILLPPGNPCRSFFEHHGFVSEGFTDDGRELLTKQLLLI